MADILLLQERIDLLKDITVVVADCLQHTEQARNLWHRPGKQVAALAAEAKADEAVLRLGILSTFLKKGITS